MRGSAYAGARRACGIVVAVLGMCALLVSCATPDEEPAPSSAGSAVPSTWQADVVSVARTASGLELTVTVQSGAQGCAGAVQHVVTEEPDRVDITLSYESTATGAACDEQEQRTVSVDIPNLEGKTIVLNNIEWGDDGSGGLAECTPPFGCAPPPADHCDAAWIEWIFTSVEVLPDHSYDIRACDGQWLVLDIDAVPDGCAPPDGASPPSGCAEAATSNRWFAQFIDEQIGWDIVASGTDGGCVPVSDVPAFPTALCEGLPPV